MSLSIKNPTDTKHIPRKFTILLESYREGKKVRKRTLLSLGRVIRTVGTRLLQAMALFRATGQASPFLTLDIDTLI